MKASLSPIQVPSSELGARSSNTDCKSKCKSKTNNNVTNCLSVRLIVCSTILLCVPLPLHVELPDLYSRLWSFLYFFFSAVAGISFLLFADNQRKIKIGT